MPNSSLIPTLGVVCVWTTLAALLVSITAYLVAAARRDAAGSGNGAARLGRAGFVLAALSTFGTAAALATLLLTHRFDIQYVYDHSARAMSPLYYFPSFWAGQEGSFLLWGFWIAVLGLVLAWTAGPAERRVMPIYSGVLFFLVGMLTIKNPFLPTMDQWGIPVTPTEGLGLNPNLENYWMVIHPPTLFLGFASLAVPFSFGLAALFWREWDGWLRRALPWGLFGFAVLGLAMMMGGYWAYEMLGWGGFWAWDPVENGPFVPWMGLLGFLHAAQIQRVRGKFLKPTLLFALLPFSGALYETFLTRTGVLDKFSVHSFSTLGGNANNVLLSVLLLSVAVSVGALLWRYKALPQSEETTEDITSREFGFTMAIVVLTLCGFIAAVGLSAPLLTSLLAKVGVTHYTATVREDYHNRALFPIAVLLAMGMGLGPHLAWRGRGGPNSLKLVWSYALAVIAALGFVAASKYLGTALKPAMLIPQLLLFTASMFAIFANLALLSRLRRPRVEAHHVVRPVWTFGGTLSHLGAAVMLVGIVCLVTFVRKDPGVMLIQNTPAPVLDGAFTVVFRGMSGDPDTDRDNAMLMDVASRDGRYRLHTRMPFAIRAAEGGQKMPFVHPAILHTGASDLYLNMDNGTGLSELYSTAISKPILKLGDTQVIKVAGKAGEAAKTYTIQFQRFINPMGKLVQQTGQMPSVFPVSAVLEVTYKGKTTEVTPQFIQYRDGTEAKSPELKLPGGTLVSFAGMNAGSADKANPGAGAINQAISLNLHADTGPPRMAFEIEASTRPMINLVWIGTLLLVLGGLVSMRRRVLENRFEPVPDLPHTPRAPSASRRTTAKAPARPRARTAKPAPSLSVGKTRGR